MVALSKKSLLLACVLMFASISAKKTHKLQLLIVPNDPALYFTINGVDANFEDPRMQGSSSSASAFILPGGTVGKRQDSYLENKQGCPINFENSIGMAYLNENMLKTVDFNMLELEHGAIISMADLVLAFKHHCDGVNAIQADALGQFIQDPSEQGQAMIEYNFNVSNAMGCNDKEMNRNFNAKVYRSETATLIKLKFDKEIEYKK